MKIIIKVLKRVVFSLALIYSFNIMMSALELFIPINAITILLVTIIGFPGLFLLVALKLI